MPNTKSPKKPAWERTYGKATNQNLQDATSLASGSRNSQRLRDLWSLIQDPSEARDASRVGGIEDYNVTEEEIDAANVAASSWNRELETIIANTTYQLPINKLHEISPNVNVTHSALRLEREKVKRMGESLIEKNRAASTAQELAEETAKKAEAAAKSRTAELTATRLAETESLAKREEADEMSKQIIQAASEEHDRILGEAEEERTNILELAEKERKEIIKTAEETRTKLKKAADSAAIEIVQIAGEKGAKKLKETVEECDELKTEAEATLQAAEEEKVEILAECRNQCEQMIREKRRVANNAIKDILRAFETERDRLLEVCRRECEQTKLAAEIGKTRVIELADEEHERRIAVVKARESAIDSRLQAEAYRDILAKRAMGLLRR